MHRFQHWTCRRSLWVFLVWQVFLGGRLCSAETPRWADVEKIIKSHFEAMPDRRANDLITRAEVEPLLAKLSALGWNVPDGQKLLGDTLAADDFLAQQLSTDAGRRFMRELSSQKLFYDQLDRIAGESGGKALIRHLLRLPDGEVFVKSGRARTVPGLVELLPKQGSGKSRRVRDFDKPTGKIYTAEQLQLRLREAYEGRPKSKK